MKPCAYDLVELIPAMIVGFSLIFPVRRATQQSQSAQQAPAQS